MLSGSITYGGTLTLYWDGFVQKDFSSDLSEVRLV